MKKVILCDELRRKKFFIEHLSLWHETSSYNFLDDAQINKLKFELARINLGWNEGIHNISDSFIERS